ncbi:MAG: hypothetical protein ACO1QB_08370, partial [Verrucomicrobiales bacterium]
MLYERWREISQKNGDALALWDFSTGQRWSFAELAREAERAERAEPLGTIISPSGNNAGFIVATL